MSTDLDTPAPSAQPAPPAPRPTGSRAWSVTWSGVRTVAALELRQRVRSTRWIVSLAVFAVIVGAVTVLTFVVAARAADAAMIGPDDDPAVGRTMFGFIVFFVMFLGLLVSPTLSATSINGDRAAGTLATLQVTLLSPAEIVLGKLLASWAASLAFLVVSVPFIVWAFAAGGTPFSGLVTTLLLLAAVLAVVCALGLGFSALTARTAGSSVLTYVGVAGLSVVSLIAFGLSVPIVSANEQVEVRVEQWGPDVETDEYGMPLGDVPCVTEVQERYVAHTERSWWLLAVNPFVVVADAFPSGSGVSASSVDPMSAIRYGVRMARAGAQEPLDECWSSQDWQDQQAREQAMLDALPPVWPWGLGALLLLGAGGVVVAVRRLTIPQGRLPRGVRIA